MGQKLQKSQEMEPDGVPEPNEVSEENIESEGVGEEVSVANEDLTLEKFSGGEGNSKPLNGGKKEATNIQIGKRSATLYLSSHSLKSKDANKLPANNITNINSSDSPVTKQRSSQLSSKKPTKKKSKDRIIPDEMLQLRVKKEFTFTGYDIMADVEPKEEIPEEEQTEHRLRQTYIESCKRQGVVPVTAISRQIANPIISLRSHSLGPKGATAIAIALVNNPIVTCLDLEDNGIEAAGAKAIAEMLQENKNIKDLNLAENLIRKEGLSAISRTVKVHTCMQSIDLTGSGFVDDDAYELAEILQHNKTLREMILSHNEFGSKGAYILATAIAQNDTLRILDLSWNHIRGEGAKAIAASLQKNIGLRKLDISWNGFTTNDCQILGVTIKDNTTLKELDISHNQLGENAIGFLMKGIQMNDGIEILRLGGNLIIPKVAYIILKAIDSSTSCRVHTLDLTDVEVDEDFLTLVDDIQGKHPFYVAYGNVIKRYDSKKGSVEGIDGNMDAVVELFKYMQENNYRVIDLMKWLDKDNSMSVSRSEFKQGMITAEVPLTEHQLDKLLDKLDMDGDGEVDFRELLIGERLYRRKMRAKQERLRATKAKEAKLAKIVLATINEKP